MESVPQYDKMGLKSNYSRVPDREPLQRSV